MSKGPLFIQYCAKDFLDGVQFLTPWEELAYRRVCDLIYATGDRVADDDRKLAAATKTGSRWPRIKESLIADGKLLLTDDGRITNARCQKEIAKITRYFSQKNAAKFAKFASAKPLENLESPLAIARMTRAKTVKRVTKEESRSKPSESVAAREVSKNDSGLGRYAPSGEPPPAPPPEPAATDPDPPTRAEVEELFERTVAALRGEVPKGIRDPVAYKAAVKDAKFTNLIISVNQWVGCGLDGEARFAAWEVLAAAERAGARSEMAPAARNNFDRIVAMHRASSAGLEAAA